METIPDPEAARTDAAALGAPHMAKLWPDLPERARKNLLAAAGRQWFALWKSAFPLDEIPACAWGWQVQNLAAPLVPPAGFAAKNRKRPLPQSRMISAFAAWLHAEAPPMGARERLRAISACARAAALDRSARRQFVRRIFRAARKLAAKRAREIYSAVLDETKNHCRQSVNCRGIWRPDGLLAADEIRHGIEEAFRAADAVTIKKSAIALVLRSHVLGEFAVIKRHRFARAGKRLKYLWRMSRARRAWIAGLVLRRLGLPAAEPLGFLEITSAGRVTESFIITRWLPGCRTAREISDAATGPRAERRAAVLPWRAEWLKLLDRGMYHADTKLSNALVQSRDDGTAAFFWTDLECVEAGARLTFYRVLRNIVQMNGSLGPHFSTRDRLYLLRGLPSRFRWLRRRRFLRIIAAWTSRRLGREKRGTCGT